MLFFLGRKLHLSHLHHYTPNPLYSTWLLTGTPFKLVKYFKISVLPSINKNSFFFTLHRLNKNIFTYSMVTAAKLLQSCPPLCTPIGGSPPGSPVPGVLQARTLEWVVVSFSDGWKWKAKVKSLSRVRLSATPWTAVYQAPLSMGFFRQEYWSGVPLPSPYSMVITNKMRELFSTVKFNPAMQFKWIIRNVSD